VEPRRRSSLGSSSRLIHRSAWKEYSRNFALTEFYEVRSAPVVAARIAASQTHEGRSSLVLTIIYGVLVIGGICLLSLGGLLLVERLVPAERRQQHNDVAGFIYAALGVIYAVLIALVVIAVWESFQAANETVEREANAVAEIFWLGNRLPEPEGTHIQQLARSYAEEVVEKEWPLMEQGQAPLMTQTQGTPTGWTLIDDIRATIQDLEPHTKADEQLYAEGLDQVQILADARRMRLVAAEEGLPGVLWVVLIFGGIAAVGFTYLFGLANTWAHRLMVVALAAVIGLVLFTIGAMEHPFSGGARIGTGAFDLILERFETSKLSNLR
jgi:Ca2+/Na+ antiporter